MIPLGLSMTESSVAPEFGPYNILMCRPGKIASFPLNASISQSGLVVALDFYPYPPPFGSSSQAIFSIRNSATNLISIVCYYDRNVGSLNIMITDTTHSYYLLDYTIYSSIPVLSGN